MAGKLKSLSLPGGVTRTFTYDSAGKVASQQQTGTGAFSYEYDENRRLQRISGTALHELYTYDSAGRIKSEHGSAGDASYTYDEAGNLTGSSHEETVTTPHVVQFRPDEDPLWIPPLPRCCVFCLPATELCGKLVAWGIIDRGLAAISEPLMTVKAAKSWNGKPSFDVTGGYLAEYKASMEARELDREYIAQTMNHCIQILRECGFVFASDLDALKVEAFLREMRLKKKSARTVNTYKVDITGFCNWLVSTFT